MLQKMIAIPKRVSLRDWSLQIVLWTGWTFAVIGAAVQFAWAHQPGHMPLLGLLVRCILVGVIGLIVLTWLEIQLEPWRFTSERPEE